MARDRGDDVIMAYLIKLRFDTDNIPSFILSLVKIACKKLKEVFLKKKPVDRDPGDDVIMGSLNRVHSQPHPITHTKFGQDRI